MYFTYIHFLNTSLKSNINYFEQYTFLFQFQLTFVQTLVCYSPSSLHLFPFLISFTISPLTEIDTVDVTWSVDKSAWLLNGTAFRDNWLSRHYWINASDKRFVSMHNFLPHDISSRSGGLLIIRLWNDVLKGTRTGKGRPLTTIIHW